RRRRQRPQKLGLGGEMLQDLGWGLQRTIGPDEPERALVQVGVARRRAEERVVVVAIAPCECPQRAGVPQLVQHLLVVGGRLVLAGEVLLAGVVARPVRRRRADAEFLEQYRLAPQAFGEDVEEGTTVAVQLV